MEKLEFRQIHDIENFYKTQFKMRFGKIPRTTHSDRVQLEQLLHQYGKKESAMLIETFFKMNDPFFKRVGYSLEYFFKNINKVIVETKKVDKPKESKAQGLYIEMLLSCLNSKCSNKVKVLCGLATDFSDMSKHHKYCGECENDILS